MGYTYKTVVVGAGIGGLACAFRLQQLGVRALVLEASERAGGMVWTERQNGFLYEAGPQCPRFPAAVWRLVGDLGLENEFVAGDPKAKRYILRDGRLHRAPFSPGGLLATGLISARAKYRLLSEGLRYSHAPADEESLAEFVERKFGSEVLNYLADPIVATVFFGDVRKMGMESALPALVEWEKSSGSVVRGAIRARKSKQDVKASGDGHSPDSVHTKNGGLRVTDALPALGSFRGGMGTLIERLAEKLGEDLRFGANVESLTPEREEDAGGKPGWQIRVRGDEELTAESVVLALPAHEAAAVLRQGAPNLSRLLADIEYAPTLVVSSAYERKQVRHGLDGFGFMAPRSEGLRTVCTFWNSSLFPGRTPEGKVLMTSFAEGAAEWMEGPEEARAQRVEAENAKILGITGAPVDRKVWKYTRALPQYNVGHAKRVKEIRKKLRGLPDFYVAGNYLDGRSIGDCVEAGVQAAEELHSQERS
jgi:protoporphyrinogen/coproporphyrinogen III oxidase